MKGSALWRVVRIVITTVYLMAGWLLFTTSLAARSLVLGAILSVVVALVTHSLFIEKSEAGRRALIPRLPLLVVYAVVLLGQIYAASFRVALLSLTRNIRPRVVHFRTRLRSDIARFALASSITLTPGTLTLDMEEDHLVVHSLDTSTTHSRRAWELFARPFERWLSRIWS